MPLTIKQLKQLERQCKLGVDPFTSEDYRLLRILIASHQELRAVVKDSNSTLEDVFRCLSGDGNNSLTPGSTGDRIETTQPHPDA